uniref:Uncharacterized protein n=1 Tax=Spongospora subterranea TaxID=70186 RepID=A0A0H5QR22_9EUKA|eukprot:CRZ04475.1 hypothetical protein [Spongospora subterranea]
MASSKNCFIPIDFKLALYLDDRLMMGMVGVSFWDGALGEVLQPLIRNLELDITLVVRRRAHTFGRSMRTEHRLKNNMTSQWTTITCSGRRSQSPDYNRLPYRIPQSQKPLKSNSVTDFETHENAGGSLQHGPVNDRVCVLPLCGRTIISKKERCLNLEAERCDVHGWPDPRGDVIHVPRSDTSAIWRKRLSMVRTDRKRGT